MSINAVAIRINLRNPNHHLYNNNGTWWIYFHVHCPDYTKARIRESLGTHCLPAARERRDLVFAHLALQAQLGDVASPTNKGAKNAAAVAPTPEGRLCETS